jgi:hypothetical protein
MKRGDAYGRWLRPILKRCINGKRFCGQVLTRSEFWRKRWNVAEHKKILVVKRFEPQVFEPICESIQSVGKEISQQL